MGVMHYISCNLHSAAIILLLYITIQHTNIRSSIYSESKSTSDTNKKGN